jgi:hypothetical protein
MGLNKGDSLNRESELREAILKILTTNRNYQTVVQIRDKLDEDLLANYKDRATRTNGVRMCLLRLVKKQKVECKIEHSLIWPSRTATFFRLVNLLTQKTE